VREKIQPIASDTIASNSENMDPRLKLKYLINNARLSLVSPLLDGLDVTALESAVFETNFWCPLALI